MLLIAAAVATAASGADIVACCEELFLQGGEEVQPYAMGSYRRLPHVEAANRPVWENREGMFMYYSSDYSTWQVGESYKSGETGLVSERDDDVRCPHHVGAWKIWTDEGVSPPAVECKCKRELSAAVVPAVAPDFLDLEAIIEGRLAPIQNQLKSGEVDDPDLNPDGSTTTPLMVASHFGYADIVEVLLHYGASPNLIDTDTQTQPSSDFYAPTTLTAITYAVDGHFGSETGDFGLFGPPHQYWATDGFNAESLQVDYHRTIDLLLQAGSTPAFATEHSYDALDTIMENRGDITVVQKLLEASDCDTLRFKLSRQWQESPGQNMYTPRTLIQFAIRSERWHQDICRDAMKAYLRGFPVDQNRMFHNVTVKDVPGLKNGVCHQGKVLRAVRERAARNTHLLLEHASKRCGIDPTPSLEHPDANDGQKALHAAANTGDAITTKVLLEYGADVLGQDGFGNTALHRAAKQHHVDVAKTLLLHAEAGGLKLLALQLEAQDAYGNTPSSSAKASPGAELQCWFRVAEHLATEKVDGDAAAGEELLLPTANRECSKLADTVEPYRGWHNSMSQIGKEMNFKTGEFGGLEKGGVQEKVEYTEQQTQQREGRKERPGEYATTGQGWREWTGVPPVLDDIGVHRCDVPVVSRTLSAADLCNVSQGWSKPFMIKNGVGDLWEARKTWTPDYLIQRYGQHRVSVGVLPYPHMDGGDKQIIPMSEFVKSMFNDEVQRPLYIFDNEIFYNMEAKMYETDFQKRIPHFESLPTTGIQLIMGGMRTGAPFHFHRSAFNSALFGRKRWLLLPPGAQYWARARAVDWFDRYRAGEVPADPLIQECVQHAGDILFVPGGYAHTTISAEDTACVAIEVATPSKPPATGGGAHNVDEL